jgi:hypothetical protein
VWTLIRRFDKQVFYVKSIQEPPLGMLDMKALDHSKPCFTAEI